MNSGNIELIANIVGLVGALLMVLMGCLKKKKDVLLAQNAQLVLLGISNVMMGGYIGAIVNVIAIFRNILCSKGKLNLFWVIIITMVTIVMGVLFNGTMMDIENHKKKLDYVHEVKIKRNSKLYNIFKSDIIKVNSRHKSIIKNKICSSRREAREFLNAGSITLNGDKVTDENLAITRDLAIEGEVIVLRRGKKKNYIVKFA